LKTKFKKKQFVKSFWFSRPR